MTVQQGKIGLIAGGGDLPARLVDAAKASGRAVFVIALQGYCTAPETFGVPYQTIRLGAVAKILHHLKVQGCTDVVLAGKVQRPSFGSIRPDWRGAKILLKIGIRSLGDDGLLRLLAREFEQDGFKLTGAHEIMTDLVASEGVLGKISPDDQAWADARHGLAVARILGQADVGQGCIVQQGLVLGLEAIEGTDEMIRRSALYARPGVGGVLVKASKPQQDKRLDLPAIGVTTVEEAHKAGLRGIALLAGGTMIIDREAVLARAEELGMFVVGLKPTGGDDHEK
ncbi:LpxI family protein [Thalassospira mesophila]|uniref:UDP-2,3-diacylglucosamine pyrophosphatase n=1 Tax=Thalassospira mesophila TaxID=1293891 RepID=A0A1Y2KZA3_9PROT|nr:UDP-2,3-diacylglucosamine diphosphatase LpxI [Thalassospira mesophila]OSQ37936.1 UDP-2,3-diacylglucosamine pyrophosphatase [Thalassospira mesophila]